MVIPAVPGNLEKPGRETRATFELFEGKVSLYVQDADSLNALMDKFRLLKGLESVKRIDNPVVE